MIMFCPQHIFIRNDSSISWKFKITREQFTHKLAPAPTRQMIILAFCPNGTSVPYRFGYLVGGAQPWR